MRMMSIVKSHPLEMVLPTRAARMLAVVILTIGTVWLSWIMQRLARGISPGIVAFEFAGTPANARRILDAWGVSGEARMLAQIGLDNYWLILYSTTLALLCVMIAVRTRPIALRYARLGTVLAWLAWAAALLDRLENLALVRSIEHGPTTALTVSAFICATIKFVIVAACLLYILGSPFFPRLALFSRTSS